MRIAVLTSLYPGSTRPFQGLFAERRWVGMHQRGHTVTVIQPLPVSAGPLSRGTWGEIRLLPREEVRCGIPIDRPRYLHIPRCARLNAINFARTGARTILADGQPQVVVADYAWPAAAVVPILRKLNIPCLISGRGTDIIVVAEKKQLRRKLARYLQLAGHWCGVSNDLVKTMDKLGKAEGRGVVVPNGVDFETFRPLNRQAARYELKLPADVKIVLVVGNLIECKDPLLALEVFQGGAPKDSLCIFIGGGPLGKKIEQQATERNLISRVRFAGRVPPEQLAIWYGACDLLLHTSKQEGRPNVVLEALASGRPTLATSAGGTSELFYDLEERMLAKSRDVEELANMLRSLLADPPSAEQLRQSVQHLSWEKSLDTFERYLHSILGSR